MNPSPDFICPQCRGELLASDDSLQCGGCGSEWPIVDGVPDFTETDIYWGEFERPVAERLVGEARAHGWREATHAVLADRPELIDYILNERRANALSLAPFARRERLLDVGAGWGAITTAASRLFDRVYSIEAVRLRAQFTHLRLEGEGRSNVALAQASLFALPFPEDFFDVILLNGILEWIGDWDRSQPPRAAQLEMLLCLMRHLRPGGLLLTGIENRIGYRYFLGRRDHNNLWGTNLLPRPLAGVVSWLCQRKPYRVFTYAMPGLRRLMRDGGYRNIRFYAPMPGYNIPNTLVPLEGRGRLAYFLKHGVSRRSWKRSVTAQAAGALERVGVLRHIPPDFLAVAQRPAEPPEPEEPLTLWDEVRLSTEISLPDALRNIAARDVIVRGEYNPGRPVMIVLAPGRDAPVLYVKAGPPEYASLLRAEHATLTRLTALHKQHELDKIAPKSHGLMQTPRGAALVMEAMAGVPLFDLLKFPGSARGAIERYVMPVVDLALELCERVALPNGAGAEIERYREEWQQAAREAAEGSAVSDGGIVVRTERLIDSVKTLRFQHGDLFLRNILYAKGGRPPLRLVDWADAGYHLPPMFDLVLFFATCWMERGDLIGRDTRVEHVREVFCGDGALAAAWREAFTRGLAQWGLADEWTPRDVAWLALAVFRRRLSGLKGPGHVEVDSMNECLRLFMD